MDEVIPLVRPTSLVVGEDWAENVELWDTDRILLEYWGHAERHVRRKWALSVVGLHKATFDDLHSEAMEAMVDATRGWAVWCTKEGLNETDKKRLYSYLMQAIDWRIQYFLKRFSFAGKSLESMVDDDGEFNSRELFRSAINQPSMHSFLQTELVTFVGAMAPGRQLVLALRFYEELPSDTIAKMMSVTKSAIATRLTDTCGSLVEYAISRVVENADPITLHRPRAFIAPDPVRQWVRAHYQCEVEPYLQWLLTCYRVDVNYLVDMLDRGYGDWSKAPSARITKMISPEDITLIDQRLAAGEAHAAIAADYGVSGFAIDRVARSRAVA